MVRGAHLASDASTSGLPLRWMSVDLNLPPAISDEDLAALWDGFHRACEGLGIAVVTGHTARYDGCGGRWWAAPACSAQVGDAYVTPTMARPGDAVVVTKGAAIEATALFAATFPDRLTADLEEETVRAADALFESMTVVPEAVIARGFGLRAMASRRCTTPRRAGIRGRGSSSGDGVGRRDPRGPRPDPGAPRSARCATTSIDPYTSISEGTLIATVVAERADAYVAALAAEGIEAAVVGKSCRRRRDGRSCATGARTPARLDPASVRSARGPRTPRRGFRPEPVYPLSAMDLLCVGDVMLDVRVDSGELARGGDVHERVALQPGGTSANAAVWAAATGASARVHGEVGADVVGRLLRTGSRSEVSRRRSWRTLRRPRGRCWSSSRRGSRWSPTAGRTLDWSPPTCPLEAGAVLVSGYLLLQPGAQEAGVEAIKRARAPWIGVEAASWPLVESVESAGFDDLAAGATIVLSERARGRGADGVAGRRCGAVSRSGTGPSA